MYPFDYPYDCDAILQKKRRLRRELLAREGLLDKKVAIVGGSTVGEVKNVLELFLLSHGIRPQFWEGEYARYYEDVVFDTGELAAFAPDVLYVHTTVQNLSGLPGPADTPAGAEAKLAAEQARWKTFWDACRKLGCAVIQNNFEMPDVRLMGNLEASDARGRVRFARRMNEFLAGYACENANFYVNDIAYLAAELGLDRWFSPSMWYAYKYAMDLSAVPALCASVANIVKSLYGKNKKSVACDLDNTLWGGVIGDDGPEGIRLGEEDPAGRAYSALQEYLKGLAAMGVVLNVDSKNEESLAREGFERPDSALKMQDFACFCANWEPKDQNLARMAKQLNLLPESFVFLDDNPAERALVRANCPDVAVPELDAPENYVRLLARSGYFEPTALSDDDRRRGEMYRQNAQRAQAEASFTDYGDYLKSLSMVCGIGAFDAPHLERITQLINKTNQFNLTTRRYSPAEVEAVMHSAQHVTLYARLADRFGDNGIVSALIGAVSPGGESLEIELWVMSCRVFKRRLENAVFDRLAAECARRGVKTVTARYIPSAKNMPVKTLYDTLGFALVREEENGTRLYRWDVPETPAPTCGVMRVEAL